MVLNRDVFRQAHFINRAVSNVTTVLLEASCYCRNSLNVVPYEHSAQLLLRSLHCPVSLAIGLLMMDWFQLGFKRHVTRRAHCGYRRAC